MYETHGIKALSERQISRLLNHHPVRVAPGTHHKIELSHEQSKKHHKAHMKGTGYTLTLDPFQVQRHQHLRHHMHGRGTGTAFGAVLGHVASGAAQAAGTRLTDAIAGTDTKANQDSYDNTAGTTMTAQGMKRRGRPRKMHGGAVNRINKYNRWTGVLGDTYHSVANVLKPVAQPIFQAGTQRAVGYINPTTQQDYYNNATMGMGIKRRGRPHKMHGGFIMPHVKVSTNIPGARNMQLPRMSIGGAMINAGYSIGGYGLKHKKKVHRKKAMHFEL